MWMDLESYMPPEISQKEKDKYCIISLTCGVETTTKEKSSLQIRRTDWWLPEAGVEVGKMGEGGQKVQALL